MVSGADANRLQNKTLRNRRLFYPNTSNPSGQNQILKQPGTAKSNADSTFGAGAFRTRLVYRFNERKSVKPRLSVFGVLCTFVTQLNEAPSKNLQRM